MGARFFETKPSRISRVQGNSPNANADCRQEMEMENHLFVEISEHQPAGKGQL